MKKIKVLLCLCIVSISLAVSSSFVFAVRFQLGSNLAWWDNMNEDVVWNYMFDSIYKRMPLETGKVKYIDNGIYHSLLVNTNGTVMAFGDNAYGQCNVPQGLSNIVQLAAGYQHSLALTVDGNVIAWGKNNYGQSRVPTGLNNVKQISAGSLYSVALKSDGTVVVWGDASLKPPYGLKDVKMVCAGTNSILALKNDGTVIGWGANSYGVCNIPSDLSNVKEISLRGYLPAALKYDGTMVTWGLGSNNSSGYSTDVKDISAGYNMVAFQKQDYSLYYREIQLFNNGITKFSSENNISIGGEISSFSAGSRDVLATLDDMFPPEATDMIVENTSGSHSPWAANLNNLGEYCLGSNTSRITLKGLYDRNGVKRVVFHVKGSTFLGYGTSTTQDYVMEGIPDGQGNWSIDLNFSDLPEMYTYQVQAFPEDYLGNTDETTRLWKPTCVWSKTIRYDKTAPTASSELLAASPNASFSTGTNGIPVTNSSIIKVNINAIETKYKGSGIQSVAVYLYNGSSLRSQAAVGYTGSDPNGNGTYTANLNVSGFAGTETQLKIRAIVYDFSNNYTIIDKSFTYDNLNPRGTVQFAGSNPTFEATSDLYFTTSDVSGTQAVEFYIWTTANGQDDLELVYGQLVPGTTNKWKATVRRDAHGYESGDYNVHIYTRDNFNNFGIAGATMVWMY